MIFDMGINLSIIYQLDEDPVEILVDYQKLGSENTNGEVSSPARLTDLVVNLDIANKIRKVASDWCGSIVSVQKITIADHPDLPLELLVSQTATGASYKIEMGTLDQLITWNKIEDTFTFHAAQAYTISFEAFIYYIETLEDLLKTINESV